MKDQKVKEITTVELSKLTANQDEWEVVDDYQILDNTDRPIEELKIDATEVFGCVSRTHKHPSGITITYSEYFTYLENEPDTYHSTSDGVDDYLLLDGCVIVDEDGDKLEPWYIQYHIPTTFMEVSDLSELAEPEAEVISGNYGAPWQGERFEIRRSYRPTLIFCGKKLSSEQTSLERGSCYYSGRVGHWDLLEVYSVNTGGYIARRVENTLWQGQKDLHRAKVCENINEVREFFEDENASQGYDDVVECVLKEEENKPKIYFIGTGASEGSETSAIPGYEGLAGYNQFYNEMMTHGFYPDEFTHPKTGEKYVLVSRQGCECDSFYGYAKEEDLGKISKETTLGQLRKYEHWQDNFDLPDDTGVLAYANGSVLVETIGYINVLVHSGSCDDRRCHWIFFLDLRVKNAEWSAIEVD